MPHKDRIEWFAGVAVLAAGTAGLAVYGAHFSGSRFGGRR